MEDPAFKPKICPIFLNASIKGVRMPNMRRQAVDLDWHWQKKWSKRMEDGSGSKAKPRRERLYDLSFASQSREKQHDGFLSRRHLRSLVLSAPRWVYGMVASPAILTALLCCGRGRDKVSPCVGKKTGVAPPKMCRTQFLRPCLLYTSPLGALRKSRYRLEVLRKSNRRRS